MDYKIFVINLICCLAFSFLIGIERQWRRRIIGLRTNVLVCIGAFLFVSFSVQMASDDITRIAAQVVSGIGFLGAGIILKDGNNVKGLNTAATLWCDAAIGVLCAGGLLIEAAIGTFCILFSNICLRFITKKMMKIAKEKETYLIKITCDENKELNVRTIISNIVKKENIYLKNIEKVTIGDKVEIKAMINSEVTFNHIVDRLMNRIAIEPGVNSIGWHKIEKEESNIDDED